jgi:purine-binding chemotaxis protein CheW
VHKARMTMQLPTHLLVLHLDEQQLALPLEVVERVSHSVLVTPLRDAPRCVLGVVNLHGQIVPVVGVRRWFRLPDRDVHLNDQIVFARTSKRLLGLLADSVHIISCDEADWTRAETVLPDTGPVAGFVRRHDGLVLVYDLESLLDESDEILLCSALDA